MEKAVADFTRMLFYAVVKHGLKSENVFISPWSIYSALSMVLVGSEGETFHQLQNGLSLQSLNVQRGTLHSLLGHWQLRQVPNGDSTGGLVQLSIANRIFVDESLPLKDTFLSTLQKDYAATVGKVSFHNSAEQAVREVNQWVSEQTHGRINPLLDPGALQASTLMVLVNAVYFKGRWKDVFNPTHTKPAPFYYLNGIEQEVPMMHRRARMDVAELPHWHAKALWMPFAGSKHELLLLLPDERDGLLELETRLGTESDALLNLLHGHKDVDRSRRDVRLSVPRVKLNFQATLDSVLKSDPLRLEDMFSAQNANLSGMSTARLKVDTVVHKAFFEMNEEGAEAAAATGISVGLTSARIEDPPLTFNVDHPFMLFIINEEHTPLFMGRVVNFN